MRVNNISFGRIIKVSTASSANQPNNDRKVDSSLFEMEKVLNGKNSNIYSKKQIKSIKTFFKNILGDYNGRDGILIRKIGSGDVVLISGSDTQEIKDFEKLQRSNRKKINKSEEFNHKLKNHLLNNTFLAFDNKIQLKLEDGTNGKNDALVTFDYDGKFADEKNKKNIPFNHIKYTISGQSYGTQIDGTIQPDTDNLLPETNKTLYDVFYEEKEVII